MLHNTVKRVNVNTAQSVNRQIFESTARRIQQFAGGGAVDIDERLRELDREWDIERVLEANAAIAVMASVYLGATVDKRWYAAPAIIGGFLLMHAVEGWCPPLPVLRRLGVRTAREIEYERNALKALRGDFAGISTVPAEVGMTPQAMKAAI